MPHEHSHDHYDGQEPIDHSHDHEHEHDHSDDITPALQNQIYSQIDFSAINTLNEATPRSGAAIVQKSWTQRLDASPELQSDADEQLLMTVPFTAQIRLHSVLIRTSNSSSAPMTLKLFVNRPDLDFATAADLQPTQTLSLSQTSDVQEVPVKRALFNTTRSLALFFEDNWSHGEEDETRISYLGFKGEWMKLVKEPVSVLYEAAAKPSDHKVRGTEVLGMGSHIQ